MHILFMPGIVLRASLALSYSVQVQTLRTGQHWPAFIREEAEARRGKMTF